jgi:hypothetical protein
MGAALHHEQENPEARPPEYVLRERSIRRRLNPTTHTAKVCGDPLPGYSHLDTLHHFISVQDALEICALYSGHPGEIVALAVMYEVSDRLIQQVISGDWFDHLLPKNMRTE